MCHEVVKLFPDLLRTDLNLEFVLLRLHVIVVADLGQVDLVRSMSIAHAIFHTIVATIADWHEMAGLTVPRTFDRNRNAEIKRASRIVNFEVGDARLDDLCLFGTCLQVPRDPDSRRIALINPLSDRWQQFFPSFMLELEELVRLVGMGEEQRCSSGVIVDLANEVVQKVVDSLVLCLDEY